MNFFDPQQLDFFWPLVLALILGAMVGFEREYIGKAAGLRTNALICMGAALFAVLSLHLPVSGNAAASFADPSRVASQIVVGIGFLGAGVIIFKESKIQGLTTAATMWVVAGVGMAAGFGYYLLAVLTALLTFIILDILARFKDWEIKTFGSRNKDDNEL